MTESEYVVRLRADISNFNSNMESARQKMKAVEAEGEKLKNGVTKSFTATKSSTESFRASIEKTTSTVKSSSNSIVSALKGIGAAAVAAFSIKQIVNFASESVNAAAKLNAMTVMSNKAFGDMSGQVQEWAKSASTAYGLSQRMALQYTSTIGAMAKGFGFTQEQAVGLSESIAARVGDLASFYSITQDEAYSKMTAIFSGETEALKSLGIVMTQTALDSYAMANGFGKTTAQMSESEKVMLRYKFLMDQTALAENDFAESSARGSWGNQIRRLKLQIEDFKVAVGQGLIAVLTPVMSLLNQLMSKIVVVGNAFADLMAKLTGQSQKQKTTVVPAVQDVGKAATDASASAEKAAQGVAKEAKKAAATILSFDQLHTMSKEEEETPTETANTSAAGTDTLKTDFAAASKEVQKTATAFDKIINKAKELKKIFSKGFYDGLGDVHPEKVIDNFGRIGDSVKKIFSNPDLQDAAGRFVEKWTYAMGQNVGAITSIGTTLATALTGGIAGYLEGNAGRITEFLTHMFDISGAIFELQGDFAAAIADIFSVFGDENGIALVENLIGIFANAFMGVTELGAKFLLDLESLLFTPIIENAESIKAALDGVIGFIASILGTLKESVDATVGKALQVYDEHVHPLMESLKEGWTDLTGKFFDGFNTHIKPVLDKLAAKFDKVWKDHIQPAIDDFLELWGQLCDTIKALWENIVKPFAEYIIDTMWPALSPILDAVGSAFLDAFGGVGDIISDIEKTAKDVLKFFEDVFKGDWEAAWNDAKKVVDDVWHGMYKIIKTVVNGILGAVETLANGVVDGLNVVISALNNLSFDIPDWIPGIGGSTFGFNIGYLSPVTLPRLPELATGGIVEDGLFRANHNELVGGFANGKTAVANNEQIEAGISIAVADAVIPTLLDILGAIKSNQGNENIIEIDGERLARIVTRNQNNLYARGHAY